MLTKNATQLNRKANQCRIVSYNPNGIYRVLSPSGKTYTVDLMRGGICTCTWGRKNGAGCAHEMAARKHWEVLNNRRAVSFQAGQPDDVARKQHKATRPVAAQGEQSLTMVLRDRADSWAEVNELGERFAAARHRRLMTNDGQVRADARAEMEDLWPQLRAAQEEAVRCSM